MDLHPVPVLVHHAGGQALGQSLLHECGEVKAAEERRQHHGKPVERLPCHALPLTQQKAGEGAAVLPRAAQGVLV